MKATGPKRKLSFKEQREFDSLPGRIERLEAEQRELAIAVGGPDFYRRPPAEIAAALARLDELPREIEGVIARWIELEGLSGS